MTTANNSFWSSVADTIKQPVDRLKAWYETTDNGTFDLGRLIRFTGLPAAPLQQALALLANQQLLQVQTTQHCAQCLQAPDEPSLANQTCSVCQDDAPLQLVTTTLYVVTKARSRDIHWMLVIHGMNTVGAWQQEFSWLLSNHYRHAVPVYIYKYGNIKIKPLLLLSQRRQMNQLAGAIRQLQQQAPAGRPDVLAHSYGTLLLSRLFTDDRYADIKLGRIILVGAIVRPDYDWAAVQQSGRIEGVMCHHSDRDHTVRLAHYTIPGTGPSGRIGFNDTQQVIHHHETDLGHSSYFATDKLTHIFPQVWLPFLTAAKPKPISEARPANWRPSWLRWVTHPLKVLLLLGLLGLLVLLVVASWHGFDATWQRLMIEIRGWFGVN
ncbi:hypothetical protein [Marinicella meishanensis]|uniref:hypothetical protein n=1 Tax=Marinicella meishanensis TaxID=2873263 RepID=UPI001CBD32F4|nr:hypothetical protein [Marinicella sp. NBU2979]